MTIALDGVKPRRKAARDPVALGRMVVIFLWIDLIGRVTGVLTTAADMVAMSRVDPSTPTSFGGPTGTPLVIDLLVFFSGLLRLACLLVVGFLVLKWIYRVVMNARTLAPGTTITPGWAIGWFFVPFANLMMPFRGVREAWGVSAQPEAWRSVEPPSVMRWWWGLWLIVNLIDNVSFRLTVSAKDIGTMIASDGFDVVALTLGVALDLVLMRVVRDLSAMQSATLSRKAFD